MHAMMSPQPPAHLPCDAAAAERTLVMGILNVTPDSFSDGGEHYTANDALAHAQRMIAQGVAGVCWIYDYRVLYGYGAGRNVKTHRRD